MEKLPDGNGKEWTWRERSGNSNGNSKRMRDNKREKSKPEFERLAWFREERTGRKPC